MDQSCEAELHPELFEFIERGQSLSPNTRAKGVLLAGEGLLRAAGHFPGSPSPKGWRNAAEGFRRRAKDRKYTLRVLDFGRHWFVLRSTSRSMYDDEFLALAFEHVPLCAKSHQEEMRLADYCHPNPGQTIPGCWIPMF